MWILKDIITFVGNIIRNLNEYKSKWVEDKIDNNYTIHPNKNQKSKNKLISILINMFLCLGPLA